MRRFLLLTASLALTACIQSFDGHSDNSTPNALGFLWGQISFTDNKLLTAVTKEMDKPVGFNFYEPTLVMADGHLVATDSWRGRVLIWNSIPTKDGQLPDVVLGKNNFHEFWNTPACASLSTSEVKVPYGVSFRNNKLAVTDRDCGRVLIWNGWPTANNQPADVIVKTSCSGPSAVALSNDKLITACQYGGTGVDVWSPIPTASGTLPTVTLTGVGVTNWGSHYGMTSDGTKLFVTVANNRGLLIWNSVPTTNVAPDINLGAPDLSTLGTGLETDRDVCGTFYMVSATATKIAVGEPSCNGRSRILIWNNNNLTNYKSADQILAGYYNESSYRLHFMPMQPAIDENTGKFALAGYDGKIMIWNSIPSSSAVEADVVLDGVPALPSQRLIGAHSVLLMPELGRVYVSDASQNRILGWNKNFYEGGAEAGTPTILLGQSNLNSIKANSGGVSGSSMSLGWGDIKYAGGKFLIADANNHRVLVYSSPPSSATDSPYLVIGQKDFLSNSANSPSLSASTLNYNHGIDFDGTRLAIADYSNNRVLIWNSLPVSNAAGNASATQGPAADVVLGQALFTTSTANNTPGSAGTPSAQSLKGPISVLFVGSKLVVADISNHRILIWNSLPTSAQVAADVVLGQADFAGGSANMGGTAPTASSLTSPARLATSGNDLWVSDHGNHRILYWRSLPTRNGQAADGVWGQPDFTSATPNNGGLSAKSLSYPLGLSVRNGQILIGDYGNSRVIGFAKPF